MVQKNTIERAFELAATGRYGTTAEITVALSREGFHNVPSFLSGRAIRTELRKAIQAARTGPTAGTGEKVTG